MAHVRCSMMRLRIGDQLVKDVTSDSCGSDNFASILFRGEMADRLQTQQSQACKSC
jgi:hypothetical protein